MAIQQVEITAKFKKAGGSYVTINGSSTVSGVGATGDAAQQNIKDQVQTAVNNAQGNLDDLNDCLAVA